MANKEDYTMPAAMDARTHTEQIMCCLEKQHAMLHKLHEVVASHEKKLKFLESQMYALTRKSILDSPSPP